uniref:Fanconi anemia group J protein n=1 Tax=Ascaris suum TaxID=6253 RepID=F1KSR4_ASCSU
MTTPNLFKQWQKRKRKNSLINGSPGSEHSANNGIERRRFMKPEPVIYSELLVGGLVVKLPPGLTPYTTQRTMMAKILMSLKNKLNALIESPTGSGKTLGLLSATCAWLVRYKEERKRSKAECRACNKHAVLPINSMLPGQENSLESLPTSLTDSPEPSTENSLDSPSVKPMLTLEDEFDSDFAASPSSTYIRRSSLLSAEMKRSRLEEADGEEKESREGHTCLPRVTIYYGTRTHKQISQVVGEFARLPYGHDGTIRHTILASREHSCINLAVRNSGDVNGKCKELISAAGVGCSYKNSMRGKYEKSGSVRKLVSQNLERSDDVWDIEDLVSALKTSSPALCPYFSSTRVLTQDADIVFCPFSYMLDPIIRDNSDVTLKNAVVILDEAHNVEDVCREAVSFSFTEREIVGTRADLCKKAAEVEGALAKVKRKQIAQQGLENLDEGRSDRIHDALANLSTNFGTVNKFMDDVLNWFVELASEVAKRRPSRDDRYTETLSWERLYTSLDEAKLTAFAERCKASPYTALLTALGVVAGQSGDEDDRNIDLHHYRPLSMSVVCVEKFLYFFKTYFKEDHRTVYKLFICIDKPFVPFGSRSRNGDSSEFPADVLDMNTMDEHRHDWLDSRSVLNGYREVKRGYRVTFNFWCMRPALAYLDAFKECRSVILASGTLCPMDTFRSELGTEFQQMMEGSQVIPSDHIFAAVIPSGPTGYPLCGTYRNINSDDRFVREISLLLKSVCEIVPKGVLCFLASYRLLDQIYEFMETAGILRQIQTIKRVLCEPRRSSQMNEIMAQYEEAITNSARYGPQCTGALMFAVFRGKVSEGIDFADDRARCVVSVGIPFPNAMDEQVSEKKKFNDDNCKKMRILTGDEWYTMQAYRALNQALGRCLRHRSDWGAILMVDERLLQRRSNPNATKVSKWIREQLRPLSGYKHFVEELQQFVINMSSSSSSEAKPEPAEGPS